MIRFLFFLVVILLCGCSYVAQTGVNRTNTVKLACNMSVDNVDDLMVSIKIKNKGKRAICFDPRYVQSTLCINNAEQQVDTCFQKGNDPVSPVLMVERQFLWLKKNQSYTINYEVPGYLGSSLAIKMSFLFFVTDSIFSLVENDHINSGYFLRANELYLDWKKPVKKKKYNLNNDALIINSQWGW